MTETTIKVSIAKLGSPIQDVNIAEGSSVMDALRAAGYNLDAVLSVKRNGTAVSMDTTLANDDVLLVSQDKIKGGNDEVVTEPNPIRLSFDITTDDKPAGEQILFYDDMSCFEIIKTVLHNKGVSMNYFKELRLDGVKVGLDAKLVDGNKYTIILDKPVHSCDDEDCDLE